jgi:type II secretory pathway pseudopilin PulG
MAADRRGFALIFVIVTLAVMLILATVVVANTAGTRQRDRLQNAVTLLLRFGYEIGENQKRPSFRGDVGSYPGQLSHLFVKIETTDRNSCGTTYSGSDINKWEGPYHLIPMIRDASYQFMPGVVANDLLVRTPTGGANADLSIVMPNVSIETAQDLGLALDGVNTGAGPRITFIPSGTNPVTVFYNIPITGC